MSGCGGAAVRLKNSTAIPNDTVREILRFVCPSGVARFDVRVGTTGRCTLHGTAYHAGSGYHATADPFVNLYIGKADKFPSIPISDRHKAGYLPVPYLASQIKALVYLAAHELRHLWQGRIPKGRRVWGARGQFSERDADAYAIRMLREWRRR
jgi:hypothetical protein